MSAPQATDLIPAPDPARLVDGRLGPGGWQSPRTGASEAVELELRLGTEGAVDVDAVALHPGSNDGEGMPSRFEVLVSPSADGEDFVSAGTFDVASPARPALAAFGRRPAARVRVRLLERGAGDRFVLGEVEVYEALEPGAGSVLADRFALPLEAGSADAVLARDVAALYDGGRVLEAPEGAGEAVIGPARSARLDVRSFPAAFVLGFFDGEVARLDGVALKVGDVSGAVDVGLSVADAPEGPFEATGPPRRLPAGGRGFAAGWYALDLDPVEARYLRVELTGEGQVRLESLAALEAPAAGDVPLAERGRVAPEALGLDLAVAALGARIVAVSGATDERWPAEALIDGTVADLYGQFPTPPGWQTGPPASVAVALPGEGAARIVAVGLDGTTATLLGEREDDFATARTFLPRRVALAVTEDDPADPGARWVDVAGPRSLRARFGEQRLALPERTLARGVRVTLLGGYGAPSVRLGEIAVYEAPHASPSAIADQALDLLAPGLGGSLVLASSEARYYEAVNVLGGALARLETPPAPTEAPAFWRADEANLPQSLTFGFRDWRVVAARRVVVAAPWGLAGEPGRPRRLALETTVGEDPAGAFTLLREVEWTDATPLDLAFDPPVSLRFLRLRVLETAEPDQPAALGPVSVVAADPAAALRPVPPAPAVAASAPPGEAVSGGQPTERLRPGDSVAATLVAPGDRHRYRLEVPEGTVQPVRLVLEATPRPAFGLRLRDATGATLVEVEPGDDRGELPLLLEAGVYELELARPFPQVAIVIDDSGSMVGTTPAVERAVRAYLDAKPDDEMVALLRFAGTVTPLQGATRDSGEVLAALDRALLTDGATALYDGLVAGLDEIGWRSGDRALILLSDGSDTASERATLRDVWTYLVESGTRLYGIGLGADVAAYDPRLGLSPVRLLDGWARATGGMSLFTTDAEALAGFYARIAADLRGPISYRLGLEAVSATGELAVNSEGEPLAGVTAPARVAFVLDCSGSMNERTASRRHRFDLARDALRSLVEELPEGLEIALLAYGHRLPPRPEEASCGDIELVVPFAALDREAFLATVDGLRARGETPIGRSLAVLGETLGELDPGAMARTQIVVVTDGEESCAPNPGDPYYPLTVADELRQRGLDVTISVVGFQVDDATTGGLEQLAEAGGGRFARATDERALSAALAELVNVPFTVLDAAGRSVATGVVGGEPVPLPAGLWRVRIEAATPALIDGVAVSEGESTRLVLVREGDAIGHRVEGAAQSAEP